MRFKGKPQPHELGTLHKVLIQSVKPYEFMLAPAFVFLRSNQKFLAVKAPLDFFNEGELERMQTYEYFYFSDFILSTLPFARAGKSARSILIESLDESINANLNKSILCPASYEVSDSILRVIGPVWWEYSGKSSGVDPYFLTVFVNSLCDLFSKELLTRVRENNIDGMELALLRSSWVVLLALLVGYCDLQFLNQLRIRVFEESIAGKVTRQYQDEIDELVELAYISAQYKFDKPIRSDFFKFRSERVSQKLKARLDRIGNEFLSRGAPPTIFGERGFTDG